jgi:hypothetical protein
MGYKLGVVGYGLKNEISDHKIIQEMGLTTQNQC